MSSDDRSYDSDAEAPVIESDGETETPPDDAADPGETTRRDLMKGVSAATATGALGALAGCSGNGGGGGGGGGSENGGSGQSSGQESVTIDYWSQFPTANPEVRKWYPTSLKRFEKMQDGKVNVQLTGVTPSGMLKKVRSAVEAGNPPDLSGRGELGIDLYPNGVTIDHSNYVKEANYSENMSQSAVGGAKFRDVWISMGRPASTVWMVGMRPKFFKQVGIDNPMDQLSTWTDYRRALEKIKKNNSNVWAYEATGAWNDLETYWAEAHTSFKGDDPWMDTQDKGTPKDPHVKIGQNPKTDGMIKNTVDIANAYSSKQAGSRGDEEIPSLLFTDRVGSYHYGLGGWKRYTTVNPDAKFGWDGDVYEMPFPKLDPNYGQEFNIPELAGKEGMRGGFSPALGGTMIFKKSKVKEQSWQLEKYLKTNEKHLIPFRTKYLPRPPTWKPALETIRKNHMSDVPQVYEQAVKAKLGPYAKNYFGAGSEWEVFGASEIRWDAINRPISKSIQGQIKKDKLPGQIRSQVMSMLKEKNKGKTL